MLKDTFNALVKSYCNNEAIANELWEEIVLHYSSKKRHYHDLSHLENLLQELNSIKPFIKDWNTILFTLFYHDIIYKALKSDNEEESAIFATKRMNSIGVPSLLIEKCKYQILATKQHLDSTDSDTNYFTDADLSVLGRNWETYYNYAQNVRKEYSIYPDLIYNPGRKKVLKHFLMMSRIFKTDNFFEKYEEQAKLNLQRELDIL
jgi:predicted metal-dependent HD superfamily phosphohydrolase